MRTTARSFRSAEGRQSCDRQRQGRPQRQNSGDGRNKRVVEEDGSRFALGGAVRPCMSVTLGCGSGENGVDGRNKGASPQCGDDGIVASDETTWLWCFRETPAAERWGPVRELDGGRRFQVVSPGCVWGGECGRSLVCSTWNTLGTFGDRFCLGVGRGWCSTWNIEGLRVGYG